MRGGVSLAVWIGGAVREIDHLRRDLLSKHPRTAFGKLARALGYDSIELDVLSGASAGGLNGVLLATAMAWGSPVDSLRDMWMRTADMRNLLYPSKWGTQMSLLDGKYFYCHIHKALDDLIKAEAKVPPVERIDLSLSVTSIIANPNVATTDPQAPVTENHIDGLIHLRHRKGKGASDFVATNKTARAALLADLALAARSTASFPFAFQPVSADGRLEHKMEFHPARPKPLILYDGGVTDNMPVGKAARAIESAPAAGPTARTLLYLHPSPGVMTPEKVTSAAEYAAFLVKNGARPLDVVRSAVKALRGKSLVEDLEALEAHNDSIRRALRDRKQLLTHVPEIPEAPPPELWDLDAERLVDLLVAPWDHLDALVPPVEQDALLIARSDEELERMRSRLAARLVDPATLSAGTLPLLARGSARPWSAVIRAASLLIEWAWYIESEDEVGRVGALKAKLYKVRDGAKERACDLDLHTVQGLEARDVTLKDAEAIADALADVRLPISRDEVARVGDAWRSLGELAIRLRTAAPVHVPPAADPRSALPRRFHRDVRSSEEPTDEDVDAALRTLDRIDVALLPLHRGAPMPSLEEIRYLTVSGHADTPLSAGFQWTSDVTPAGPRFDSLVAAPTGEPVGTSQLTRVIDPGSKLAGNQLHNFAAFLRSDWRANDWMWGQADAAATLVDVLLDADRVSALRTEEIEPIIADDFTDEGLPDTWRNELKEYGEETWAKLEAELPSILALEPEDRARALRPFLLWRRHLEITAVELARSSALENPSGVTPRASLCEAFTAWDNGARGLDAIWGTRQPAALGVRATFVGWKALFAKAGWKLSLLRTILAPLIAPLAGFYMSRRRSAFAIELFLLAVILPRTTSSRAGLSAVMVFGVGFLLLWFHLTRSNTKLPEAQKWWSRLAILVTLILVVSGAIGIATSLTHFASSAYGTYYLPLSGAAVATFVTWHWARWPFTLFVTAADTAIVGWWEWLGSHATTVRRWGYPPALLNHVGSLFWALVALALVTTLIGYNLDVSAFPRNTEDS